MSWKTISKKIVLCVRINVVNIQSNVFRLKVEDFGMSSITVATSLDLLHVVKSTHLDSQCLSPSLNVCAKICYFWSIFTCIWFWRYL